MKTGKITSALIGETSAGGLCLHIYRDGDLVYSHDYFANGATDSYYKSALRQAIDDMLAMEDWESWEDSDMIDYNDGDTTLETLTFDGAKWELTGRDTISDDVIRENKDRLPDSVTGEIEG